MDRLNEFIGQQSYRNQVFKAPNSLYYWRPGARPGEPEGLPVNVRRSNGRSGANVFISAKASQAAKRAGPGLGPGSARAMYGQIMSELDAELGTQCPVIPSQGVDMIETMIMDTVSLTSVPMEGGSKRKTRSRKQKGGARFYDELKRVLRILCLYPQEISKEMSNDSAEYLKSVGDTLSNPSVSSQIAKTIVGRIPSGLFGLLLVRDLGSNDSLTVRAINSIVTIIGTFINPFLTAGWYSALVGNIGTLMAGSGPTRVGLATVVAMNYQGVRVFQGLYRKSMEAFGASPSKEQMAEAFEGTLVQFIRYLGTEALVKAYGRFPESVKTQFITLYPSLHERYLNDQLALYMSGVPAAQEFRRVKNSENRKKKNTVQRIENANLLLALRNSKTRKNNH